MKKILFYFFCALMPLFSVAGPAQEQQEHQNQLEQGIQAYQKNDFEKALQIFENLNRDIGSAGLFGYIGNCHVKMNHLGEGISAYLSALKRDPNNPDLRHNLTHALSQTQDRISLEEDLRGLRDVFLNTVRLASVPTHRFIFCGLFVWLWLVCAWYGIHKNALAAGRLWIVLLSLALVLQGSALFIRSAEMEQKQGVVTAPSAKVRYGPSQTDTEAFLLHLGAPFEIHHREGNWVQIRLKDGKAGWLPSDSFAEVK